MNFTSTALACRISARPLPTSQLLAFSVPEEPVLSETISLGPGASAGNVPPCCAGTQLVDHLFISVNAPDTNLYVDNVVLTFSEAPEPNTATFVFGGLVMLAICTCRRPSTGSGAR